MVFVCCFAKPAARYEADLVSRPARATASVPQQSQTAQKASVRSIHGNLDANRQAGSQNTNARVIASISAAEPKTPISKTTRQLSSHKTHLTPTATKSPVALIGANVANDVAADAVTQEAPKSARILKPKELLQLDLRQVRPDKGSLTPALHQKPSSPANVMSDTAAVKRDLAGPASAGGAHAAVANPPASIANHVHKSLGPAAAAAAAAEKRVGNTPRSARSRTPSGGGNLSTPRTAKSAACSGSPAIDQFKSSSPQPSSTSTNGPCSASVCRLTRPTAATTARAEAVAASRLATPTSSQSWKW